MKQYKIITYGCQMNVHESEKIAGVLSGAGCAECTDVNDADIIVFNTCCIRENAEQKATGNIGALKKLKKDRPGVIIAVCGCMTQQEGKAQKLKDTFPFIDIIFGTHNIHLFKEYLDKRFETGKSLIEVWEKEGGLFEDVPFKRDNKINAFVNIMTGCNNFCTYCIVPYVRGRERSRPHGEIFAEVKSLIAGGYKEIMLLGQNVNSYGNDLTGGIKFYTLLEELCKTEGKFRLRFMTSHPKDLEENLVKTVAENEKICNNIHLPVQSGSDRILKLMNRKYTSADYLKKIETIYKYIPDCGITSDIMVGFPGETDKDFQDTLSLVEKAKYTGCYTFIYSVRTGTAAAKMENQVPDEVKKERIKELILLQNKITKNINKEKYLNNTFEVLTDGKTEKGENSCCGRTDSGRLVSFLSNENVMGQFVNVKVVKSAISALTGEIV